MYLVRFDPVRWMHFMKISTVRLDFEISTYLHSAQCYQITYLVRFDPVHPMDFIKISTVRLDFEI